MEPRLGVAATGALQRPRLHTLILGSAPNEDGGANNTNASAVSASSRSTGAPGGTTSVGGEASETLIQGRWAAPAGQPTRMVQILPPHPNNYPVAAGGECHVSEAARMQVEKDEAVSTARTWVWPYIKFVLGEDDMDITSPMAELAFSNILTQPSCLASYWKRTRDDYVKTLQSKRFSCTHGVKKAFLGTYGCACCWCACTT